MRKKLYKKSSYRIDTDSLLHNLEFFKEALVFRLEAIEPV